MSARRNRTRRVIFAVVVIAAFTAGLMIKGGGGDDVGKGSATMAQESGPTVWTCSMHPQIQLPEAGQCPICFMDLIPLENEPATDDGPRVLSLSESGAALADVRTAPVERRFVAGEVRLLGRVVVDETRSRTIAAWVAGRLDTLFVDFTGETVSVGDPLASIYSPDLYAAQVELLNAKRGLDTMGKSVALRGSAEATLEAARERLRLWGLSAAQVAAVEARGKASHHIRIRAPAGGVVIHKTAVEGSYVQTGSPIYQVADLSRVWVELEAYESDLPWLRLKQPVTMTVEGLPGRSFEGEIVFLDPVLDRRTRTVAVRIEVDNKSGELRPGMFAHAVVAASLTAEGRPHLEGEDAEPPLVIPAEAPLLTGNRAVVYVQLTDRDRPTFEGREIVLGPRAGDFYLVASGLEEGERVVVQGAFKIDSALQIQAKPSMMNPSGGGPMPGHNHGGSGGAGEPAMNAAAEPGPVEVPGTFRDQFSEVLQIYLVLQASLAGDDGDGTTDAARRLSGALDGMDMSLLDHEAHMVWMTDLDRIRPAVEAVATAASLAGVRQVFEPLSDALWDAVKRYRPDVELPIRLFHCPMAGPDGANWMQLETVTANPYYGSAMLRCGSQIDTLATAGVWQ